MKKIQDLKVVANENLSGEYFILTLRSGETLPQILPGQFLQLSIEDAPRTFLRRPFSVHDVDYEQQTITLFIKRVGPSTRRLGEAAKNEFFNAIFPLGNTFTLDPKGEVLLIGGGCGIAPLFFLSKYLSQNSGIQPTMLIGGRNRDDIVLINEIKPYSNLYITTEDGSVGEKGFVTDHSILSTGQFHHIYACGPKLMNKAIADYAFNNHIEAEVSLEHMMACGIGACLCCVADTTEGYQCVCTEGPVFNINKLKWSI